MWGKVGNRGNHGWGENRLIWLSVYIPQNEYLTFKDKQNPNN